MATSDIDKVFTLLNGIASGNPDIASSHISPEKYVEHNPRSADGIEGLREYVSLLPKETDLKVVRAFQDGDYVFTQRDGLIFGQNTFFDIFKFNEGLIVEHWLFSAEATPPNKSGHTQADGPTQPRHMENTEKNKALVRDYYHTFHIRGNHSQSDKYFNGDVMVRHEPGVRDGVAEFMRDVDVLMQHRTIDEIKLLLGQGDFVLVAAKGTHEGNPCFYIDLYRVEDDKIVEHWGFPEKVPQQAEWKNNNGML